MKILMTVTLAMLVSASVFAECKKEGDKCTKDECAKIGSDLAVNEAGLCVKVAASQTDTQCAGIVGTSGAKQTGTDTKTTTQGTGSNTTK